MKTRCARTRPAVAKYLCSFLLALMAAATVCGPARADVVQNFDSEIHVHKDSSFDVVETIQVDFQTAWRHGIYRDIPVKYVRNGGTYSIYLNVKSITDGAGNSVTYTSSLQGKDLHIKIGDSDRTITGVQTYRISYYVRRAVNWFQGAPELYWNACGDQWTYPLNAVSVNVYPPAGVPAAQLRITSFAGPVGTTTPAQSSVQDDRISFATTNIEPGSDLTVVCGFPAGALTQPSKLQIVLWFLADWWSAILFPLCACAFVISKYMASGRDVDGGMAAGVEWDPPKELSPAEVGTLIDEKCDMSDIVSTLVDLAARGYLVIQETQSEKFLFMSSKDYTFIRQPKLSTDAPGLAEHESQFLSGVFGSLDPPASDTQVTLSSLKNHFYTHLPGIRNAIYDEVTTKGLFTANPNNLRGVYVATGAGLLIVGVIATIIGSPMGMGSYGIGLAIAGAIVAAASKAMPSKTAKGSRLLRECLGFQRFVRLAEKDRIAVLAKDDPTIFGRLLPYAMVLGVADHWAYAFKDLMSQPPDWYQPYGYGPGYVFMPTSFVHDLGGGMNTMGNTFSSQPQSSGGSGGSGFSGGFSGGGFGGGGGGSW